MKKTDSQNTDTGQEDPLLGGFKKPSYGQWLDAVKKTLRGASFEKRLKTQTHDGLVLNPIYNSDDLAGLGHLGGYPGVPGYVRGTRSVGEGTAPWQICQEITGNVPDHINAEIKSELTGGSDAIRLDMHVPNVAVLEAALADIPLETTPIHLDAGPSGLSTLSMLIATAENKGTNPKMLQGAVDLDPLHALARDGLLATSLSQAFDEMAVCTRFAVHQAPLLKTIRVSTDAAHDSGGSAIDELAFGLATGVTYIRELGARELEIDEIATHMGFSFSVRGNFFMEVAKLRAARLLWSRVVSEFGGSDESAKMVTHVRTSMWNKSALDPYVNMLRATTETLAAAVGGADTIQTGRFDEAFRTPDDFSRRNARNVQNILREECGVGRVLDPAGGSYFVEKLTDELARPAWGVFQEIEKQGGMTDALKKGYCHKRLEKVATKRLKDFASRKSIIVGTNQYADPNPISRGGTFETADPSRKEWDAAMRALIGDRERKERISPFLEKLKAVSESISLESVRAAVAAAREGALVGEIRGAYYGSAKWGSIEIEPFNAHRASMPYEQLHQTVLAHTSRTGEAPRVFLANAGPLSEYKARADFSRGFFEVGKFDVVGNTGFETPAAAAEAALKSGASISVVCGADTAYPNWVPEFVEAVKKKAPSMIVLLAGYPKDQIEAHKKSGVDGFIHMKADHLGMLKALLNQVGVSI